MVTKKSKAGFDNLIEGKNLKDIDMSAEEVMEYTRMFLKESSDNPSASYPSQGILQTPYDNLDVVGHTILTEKELTEAIKLRRYLLELANHPIRLHSLNKVSKRKFMPIPKVKSPIFEKASSDGVTLALGDLGATVGYPHNNSGKRISRRARLSSGPYIKLGKRARLPFVCSAMPDVWGSVPAIATAAAFHCLTCIPRNGLFADVGRQADLAKGVLEWLRRESKLVGGKRRGSAKLFNIWSRNLVATLSASKKKALKRAEALYNVGIKAFRVYSPEPGDGPIEVVRALRKSFGENIEIFSGQAVSVNQAKRLEESGSDAIYIGIGGGGRCKTGPRSGTVVDWPQLAWDLRGEVSLPIIAEGGASEYIAVSFLLGISGIGVSRMGAGGSIESPGGAMYLVDKKGRKFKPYGGEASARTKWLEGKMMRKTIPMFVEGETTKARSIYATLPPTMTVNLYFLLEEVILSLVFRGVRDIYEMHLLDPSPLRKISIKGVEIQNVH